ncbi:MAG: hypothetical protein BGO49_10665 [Planctomycetales bacterium 71-10]|nr:MAG: hypothetical protein BGO49_10665 [Planctomycetales bacterium 71-10]
MVKALQGVVRGRTIEFDEEVGVEDGRRVEVVVRSHKTPPGPPPGWRPGVFSSAAGAQADHWTEEDDRILADIERDRHRPSTSEISGPPIRS